LAQHEPALDHGLGAARTDPPAVGATAEQQVDPLHDHRLAGAGLPRHDRQPGRQLEHGVLDDAEPFTDTLVRKFDLPVEGWRGRREHD
ncbi:MAG: hypothetical protein JWN17_597, partial [Frankiales bacterium]|nr:hypothetical protein [Frankiales bacterium]